MSQKFRSLLLPTFIILFCLYGSLNLHRVSDFGLLLLQYLPWMFIGIVFLLAWHYNKGQYFISVCLLALPQFSQINGQVIGSPLALYTVAFANLSLLNWLQERGFWNRYLFNRFALIGMQVAWCFAFAQGYVVFAWLDRTPFQGVYYSIGDLMLFCVIGVSLVSAVCFWWLREGTTAPAVLASLVLMLILIGLPLNQVKTNLLLSGAMLIWIVTILMVSHQMAYVDELTRLQGRRALNEKLLALPKHYFLVMLDVDHFKKFNDTYGHQLGDEVLKLVAACMQQFSGGAKTYRYGGEEFTLLFSSQEWAEVSDCLELLREEIAAIEIPVVTSKGIETTTHVTVSMGAAAAKHGVLPDDILKQADEALYQAKRKGRNRVELSR